MNYSFEKLSPTVFVATSAEHTFGTDAVLLSHFAQIKEGDRAIDLGTGCGIVPLYFIANGYKGALTCIDIQENAIEQVTAGAEKSGVQNQIDERVLDLRNLKGQFKAGEFTLVTMNPPYKPVNTGIISSSYSAKIARHEVTCTLNDVAQAANYLLNYGGRLVICHRPERMADVIVTMREHALEPKTLRLVCNKLGEKPFLFLLECKKNSHPFLTVEPPLYLKNEDGTFTPEALKFYGTYAEEYLKLKNKELD